MLISYQLPPALSIGAGCPPPKLYTRYDPRVLAMAPASKSRPLAASAVGTPAVVDIAAHNISAAADAAKRRRIVTGIDKVVPPGVE